MTWFGIQSVAQVLVERVLNSLPEGILIALCAWLLLRLIGRQNSGTRFAVWFMALIAVVGLSFPGAFKPFAEHTLLAHHITSQLIVPSTWAVTILAVWAVAAFLALTRVAAGLFQVWAIRRSCREISPSQFGLAFEETFRRHSAGRPVRLAVSDRVKVPAAIGFWKPAIVLPTWTLQELTPNELIPVLIHELTHLQRRDDWTNLLQKIVRAVFFFHPAVWWIDSRLSLEREMACDDVVLAHCNSPQAYAGCLIDLLEKSCARRGWTMAQAAVHRARDLSLRITQILDAKRPPTTRVWKPALGLVSIFSLACFAISSSAPQLVTFAPDASHAAPHVAKARIAPRADNTDMTAAVVPVSFHLPVNRSLEHHTTAKRHNPSRPPAMKLVAQRAPQRTTPRIVMAKATRSAAAPTAQMVVFIQTTTYGFDQPGNGKKAQTTESALQTQVWHILLIAPAQLEVTQSAI